MIKNKNVRNDKLNIVTFGCRLNTFESEVIKNNNNVDTNTLVFNTCAVTSEAERQARQAVRRYKKEQPTSRIIVTGCSAQINPKSWFDMPEVSGVVGNKDKLKKNIFHENKSSYQVDDIMKVQENTSHMLHAFNNRARVFLEIQNGCNHRCSFCIIPFARGNSRSIDPLDIVENIVLLVKEGFKEVVLTGVDIGDYGKDLKNKITLSKLIKYILSGVPNLSRLRLSSIDPKEIDNELFNLIINEKRLMPYIHFSAQSGDDNILKKMRRRHRRKDIINLCKELKRDRSDLVFGADLIAGFPFEDEEMFENTLDLIEECGLTFLHVFPYSIREGTDASKYPQIELNVRKKRAKILRLFGNFAKEKLFNSLVGKKVKVLVEDDNAGYTEGFIPVKFNSNLETGTIHNFKIISSDQLKLNGILEKTK
ncbi:MAG: tRNA (N(6)-L-threonylcarbamoyladenosine(37)-C(2))-methylthiotransferase MtaB [Rhodospirillaceae bacterium]|nr:tRNA (N(6)-L-threonylcarbamoyladenosine(37)-C(2))-methylthiotransferase MtaB [Rhodospirillaceae bacterium]|tara:strand:- start:59389 stop:60657 length:1269 start_codon:yes stop_codon:yes gene_type:complete